LKIHLRSARTGSTAIHIRAIAVIIAAAYRRRRTQQHRPAA